MCFSWGPRYEDRDEWPRDRGRFDDRDSSLPPNNPISGRSGASNPHISPMPGHKLNPDWDPKHPYDYPKFVREPRGYQPVQGIQAQPPPHQAGDRSTGRASAASVSGGGGGIDPWGRGRGVSQTSNRFEAGPSRGIETNNSRRGENNPSRRSGANNSRRNGTDAFMGPPSHGARTSATQSEIQASRFHPDDFMRR